MPADRRFSLSLRDDFDPALRERWLEIYGEGPRAYTTVIDGRAFILGYSAREVVANTRRFGLRLKSLGSDDGFACSNYLMERERRELWREMSFAGGDETLLPVNCRSAALGIERLPAPSRWRSSPSLRRPRA